MRICRKGLIYFPDFCALALERMRETEAQDEDFRKTIFKVFSHKQPSLSPPWWSNTLS